MRKIGIRRLTHEAFARYGNFASLLEPQGESAKLGASPMEFYCDMVQQNLGCVTQVSYSVAVVKARPRIIDVVEYHDHTQETIICLEGDYLMYVAPACAKDEVPYDNIEVFLVPRGTVVNVKAGIWHAAGFPYKCDKVHFMFALPERAYATDCHVLNIPEEHQIEVVEEFID